MSGANVILWMGPISTANLAPGVPAGWELRTYNTGAGGNIGSNAFRDWMLQLGPGALTKLAGKDARNVILAAFSAGHGATEVLLQRAADEDDDRVQSLIAADAYYISEGALPKAGHYAWLRGVADEPRGRGALFTSSTHHGPGYLSCSDSLAGLSTLLGMSARSAPAGMPLGATWRGLGSIWWGDYGANYDHGIHGEVMAQAALKSQPWLSAPRGAVASGGSGGLFALLAAAAAGLFLLRGRHR